MKPKVFLLYPYYWPNYKAGGPVQSLFNLVSLFRDDAEFYLVASVKDIDGSDPSLPVVEGSWTKGPNGENIYFTKSFSLRFIYRRLREVRPQVVFANGMFNLNTTLPGIFSAKLLRIKLVISPRGMLQTWALKRNPWVKKIALVFFRSVLGKHEAWHATDEQERQDIHFHFGKEQQVHVASNVPKTVVAGSALEFPMANEKIRLIFLSLLNRNKNLHLVVEAVNALSGKFSLDIYGPIADAEYWKLCQEKITDQTLIAYKGGVPPWRVSELLQTYHFLVLPTVGENFGHAIFDSLACGVPVLISRTTPWQDIEKNNAGFYIDTLDNAQSLIALLKKVGAMAPKNYQQLRSDCHQYARNYWSHSTFKRDYQFLIGNV